MPTDQWDFEYFKGHCGALISKNYHWADKLRDSFQTKELFFIYRAYKFELCAWSIIVLKQGLSLCTGYEKNNVRFRYQNLIQRPNHILKVYRKIIRVTII